MSVLLKVDWKISLNFDVHFLKDLKAFRKEAENLHGLNLLERIKRSIRQRLYVVVIER